MKGCIYLLVKVSFLLWYYRQIKQRFHNFCVCNIAHVWWLEKLMDKFNDKLQVKLLFQTCNLWIKAGLRI